MYEAVVKKGKKSTYLKLTTCTFIEVTLFITTKIHTGKCDFAE